VNGATVGLYDDVGAFNVKFGLPHFGDGRPPEFLTEDVLAFRIGFIAEELAEFCAAHSTKNMAKAADALVDLAYVILGTAHFMGIPFDGIWAEVQRTNMTKVRLPDSGITTKIVKPEGWVAPDHEPVLRQAHTTFYSTLLAKQQPLGREFEQVLYENLWDLYERS
jgi:predicted HAD superfamily Cof-like phosphohydrolase